MPILVDFILAIYAALCFKQLSYSLIMVKIAPNFRGDMNPKSFFLSPVNIAQKQYEALRSFYTGECSASDAAKNTVILYNLSILSTAILKRN